MTRVRVMERVTVVDEPPVSTLLAVVGHETVCEVVGVPRVRYRSSCQDILFRNRYLDWTRRIEFDSSTDCTLARNLLCMHPACTCTD